jgi:hypothetical protein
VSKQALSPRQYLRAALSALEEAAIFADCAGDEELHKRVKAVLRWARKRAAK